MMKGISVWLFSKMVMLIFLLMVFATVLGFLNIVNEKVGADSAELLATQIKDSLGVVASGNFISVNRLVPLPEKLPEKSDVSQTPETRSKTYSVHIIKQPGSGVVTVAISWELTASPKAYAAASSFTTKKQIPQIWFSSADYHFLTASFVNGKIEICGCEKAENCRDSTSTDRKCNAAP